MREIKFRAWFPEDHWYISEYGDDQMVPDYESDRQAFESFGFCAEEIAYMQYTGLKDKNGVEIYEGDLLSFRIAQFSGIAEVEWFDDGWCLNLNDLVVASAWIPYLGELNYMEVVGNIHENPELLEKSK